MVIFGKGKMMKTIYGKILVSAITAAVALCIVPVCVASEGGEQGILSQQGQGRMWRRRALTDEKIERIMSRLKESEPEKAKELEQLRKKDEEAFKAELRKVMRKHFGARGGKHEMRQGKGGFGAGPHGQREAGFRGGGRGLRGFDTEDMSGPERRERYLKWLRSNYPEKAEKLAELREKNPELYGRKLQRGRRRHGRIMEASRKCPELGAALKESMELKDKRDRLLEKIKSAAGEDEKKQLVDELEQVVSRRFDLLVKRRQIRYELLQEKLVKMQEHVRKIQVDVEKWNDPAFRKENVKKRLEELMKRSEQFKWD